MVEQVGAPSPPAEESIAEKRFYLDEFHEKTLFFALAPGSTDPAGLESFLSITRELVREDARVVVMVEDRKLRPSVTITTSPPSQTCLC